MRNLEEYTIAKYLQPEEEEYAHIIKDKMVSCGGEKVKISSSATCYPFGMVVHGFFENEEVATKTVENIDNYLEEVLCQTNQ